MNVERIVADVAEEWAEAGKLHDPPDDTSRDDDLAFWSEVERRRAQSAPRGPQNSGAKSLRSKV